MNHFNHPMMAALGRCFLALISVCVLESNLPAAPMVYTGTVVTDVRVGTTLLHNASVKITFEGDTNNISSVNVQSNECLEFGGFGWFLFIPSGVARMEIESQGRTRRARLNDGQIFVTVDECNGGIGFGSFIGPNNPPLEPAYPLGLTIGTAEYAAITNFSPLTLSALPGLPGHASAFRRCQLTACLELRTEIALHRTLIPSSRTSEISSSTKSREEK